MTLCHFQPCELLQVTNDVSFQVKNSFFGFVAIISEPKI